MSTRLIQALTNLPPESLGPGDRLRLWREGRGEQQQALARRLGISQPHLARIESGERMPGAALRRRLRRMSGVEFTVEKGG